MNKYVTRILGNKLLLNKTFTSYVLELNSVSFLIITFFFLEKTHNYFLSKSSKEYIKPKFIIS